MTARDDGPYTVIHDRVLTVSAAVGVLDNDSGIGLTAAKRTNPGHGTVTVNSNGSFTYRPAAGYVGPDSFTYDARVLNLGILVTDTATVTLNVTNPNGPTAANDNYSATTGVQLSVSAAGVLANDSDADGDSLTASLVDGGGNGSLDLNSNGSFTFTSGGSFTGTRTFTYKASDGIRSSNTATVTITVSAPAATPTPPPTPTAPPTATPTAPPTPTPRVTPTPTPRPTPTPIIPLPTLPLPTPTLPPLPTLPLPTPTLPPLPTLIPTPTPRVTPTPAPGATQTPGTTTTPGAGGQPSPGSSSPIVTPSPGAGTTPTPTPGSGATNAPGTGAGTTGGSGGGDGGTRLGAAPGDRFLLPALDPSGIDAIIDGSFTGFGGIEWAVPAFALGVPGFLLMIAIAIQTMVGVAWLPFVRRWLGGFGVRRRERAA